MTTSGKRNLLLCAACAIAVSSSALAIDPPPGGGYPNDVTALGTDALFDSVTAPSGDTAIGYHALYSSIIPSDGSNTAVGWNAMTETTTGYGNTVVGWQAMYANTTGAFNVAIGESALIRNSTGGYNVAIGNEAMSYATNGYENVAIGSGPMVGADAGGYNVAIGYVAMGNSTGTGDNVAIGDAAMNQSSGSENIAIGQQAGLLFGGRYNIAIGRFAGINATTGRDNIFIGQNAAQNVVTGSNNVEIASLGAADDNGTIRIGDAFNHKQTFVAGISGVTIASGAAVMINDKGQLGVATSSARFKDNIEPMNKASEAILSLQPVTFRYKKEIDAERIPQFGLVAEDVAKVDPDLVIRDDSGKPFTVRYEAVNAMLLNEFLKEHRKVETQEGEIAELRAQLKAAVAQIQRVSAQVQAERGGGELVSIHN